MQPSIYVGRGMHESQFALLKYDSHSTIIYIFVPFENTPSSKFSLDFQVHYILVVAFDLQIFIQFFCPGKKSCVSSLAL